MSSNSLALARCSVNIRMDITESTGYKQVLHNGPVLQDLTEITGLKHLAMTVLLSEINTAKQQRCTFLIPAAFEYASVD